MKPVAMTANSSRTIYRRNLAIFGLVVLLASVVTISVILAESSSSSSTTSTTPQFVRGLPTDSPTMILSSANTSTSTSTSTIITQNGPPSPTNSTGPTFLPSPPSWSPTRTAFPSRHPTATATAQLPSISPTAGPSSSTRPSSSLPPTLLPWTVVRTRFEVLETVPHDSNAFTQGLQLIFPDQQQYYESTGLYGRSSVRIVDLYSGEVLHIKNLASLYFAEGITRDSNGRLVQITWREETGFIYNATNLDTIQEFSYQTTNGHGWGICYEPFRNVFFVSDGTNYLHTWNSPSLELVAKVPVSMRILADSTNSGLLQDVKRLNELEWDPFSKTVLANVWQTNYLVRIDPNTGFVTHRYDLESLYRPVVADVLNGIAMTDVPNEIWATGKLWPYMYRIRLVDIG